MNIELPRRYVRATKDHHVRIRSDGVLEIKGCGEFYKIMSDITYALKGKKICQYCRREIQPCKMTMDHLYPKEFGGISITNNLGPACANCNREKGSLNEEEYRIMRTLSSKAEKDKFYRRRLAEKNHKKYSPHLIPGFDLPVEWIEYKSVKRIKAPKDPSTYRKSKNYSKARAFIKKNNFKIPQPIVISSNGVILEGKSIYFAARDEKLLSIPVIVLENVVVLDR